MHDRKGNAVVTRNVRRVEASLPHLIRANSNGYCFLGVSKRETSSVLAAWIESDHGRRYGRGPHLRVSAKNQSSVRKTAESFIAPRDGTAFMNSAVVVP
jgi:hypothetical protein